MNKLNIFMEHDLNILMIFGIKENALPLNHNNSYNLRIIRINLIGINGFN